MQRSTFLKIIVALTLLNTLGLCLLVFSTDILRPDSVVQHEIGAKDSLDLEFQRLMNDRVNSTRQQFLKNDSMFATFATETRKLSVRNAKLIDSLVVQKE
jgi:hypothetical protein